MEMKMPKKSLKVWISWLEESPWSALVALQKYKNSIFSRTFYGISLMDVRNGPKRGVKNCNWI